MMDSFSLPIEDRNLALLPGTRIFVSMENPTGSGSKSPQVLLNETAHRLDGKALSEFSQERTFDTFHGRNERNELDWYAIHFPRSVRFNCVEMTMGYPYRDGGWWTSLNVEVVDSAHNWRPVTHLEITPPYNFTDSRANRRLFETYQIFFDDVTTRAVRVIGVPGGLVRFTSLARLGVYHRDLSRWSTSSFVHIPRPYIFRLIDPCTVWDLSEALTKATGIGAAFTLTDYYLDQERMERSWAREVARYTGQPTHNMLVGDVMGWDFWRSQPVDRHTFKTQIHPEPYVNLMFYGCQATAVAPVAVEGEVLAAMISDPALLIERISDNCHREFARKNHIPWEQYQASMRHSPQKTLEQMEGIAEILGVIANTIAQLAHHNQLLRVELSGKQDSDPHRALINRAVQYMQDHLEEPVTIAEVAREIGLNPSYFSTVFTRQMGCLPVDYLARLRVERAKEYLRHTSLSVMEVCVALNYTPSYFNRLFKRQVGMTPGEYARQARELS